MTEQKILEVVERYRKQFEEQKIPKKRIDTSKKFKDVSTDEALAHAHYLLDGIEEYAKNPEKVGKTGRHLGSLQTILSYAGWISLDDMMDHNRSDKK